MFVENYSRYSEYNSELGLMIIVLLIFLFIFIILFGSLFFIENVDSNKKQVKNKPQKLVKINKNEQVLKNEFYLKKSVNKNLYFEPWIFFLNNYGVLFYDLNVVLNQNQIFINDQCILLLDWDNNNVIYKKLMMDYKTKNLEVAEKEFKQSIMDYKAAHNYNYFIRPIIDSYILENKKNY